MNIGFFFKTLKAYDAHIAPFLRNAPGQDHDFVLFNMGKIYSPDYDKDAIECKTIDLSFRSNIKRILSDFELDFMVFFNPGHIYALFLVEICKQLSIVPIYFQHGLSLDLASFDFKTLTQDKSMRRKFISLRKYLVFYFSICINLFFIKRRWVVLKHLLTKSSYLGTYLFRKSSIHKLPKYGLKDVHCQYGFVYGENDKKYLVESMNMNPERIVVSGYPFLTPTKEKSVLKEKGRVLYLTSAFRATGLLPLSIRDEKDFYLTLYEQVTMAGYELDIKVHPVDDFELIKSYFEECEYVDIYKDVNLADVTMAASIVISEFSTALFYAIKYYKPIIILTSEYFESYPFDYTKHGIGIKSNLNNLRAAIRESKSLKPEKENAYREFISNFLLGNNNSQSAYLEFYAAIEKMNL